MSRRPASHRQRVLEVHDLVTHFETPRGAVHAVDGVSLQVDSGETLAVVGESGSGKSVLVRSIMGLLPRRDVHHSGRIVLAGVDQATCTERERRASRGLQMGMIFQDPMTSLNPVRTIGAVLREVLTTRVGLARSVARERSLDLLRSVGIPEPARRLDQYPHELSGGMRQRVMIALALAGEPALLLADEPTTALDVTVQAQIMALLAGIQSERSTAIILVTHDLGLVAGRSDRVMVMYAGQVVERATTEELFRAPRMPYTAALLDAMPRIDGEPNEDLATIPGRPPVVVGPQRGCRFAPRCTRVQERCHVEEPPLEPVGDDQTHEAACWYPVGLPERRPNRAPTEMDVTT